MPVLMAARAGESRRCSWQQNEDSVKAETLIRLESALEHVVVTDVLALLRR